MNAHTLKSWLYLALVVGLILPLSGGCQKYDELIEKDQACQEKWANYEAALQRRADLVPNVVETVKAQAAHEKETLSAVMKARASATSIQLSAEDLEDPAKVAAFQKAQDNLQGALSRLMLVQEKYPELRSSYAFHELRVSIEGSENRILRAREEYNSSVRGYNSELGKIKGSVVNKATGRPFKPRVYFKAQAGAEVAPKVKF